MRIFVLIVALFLFSPAFAEAQTIRPLISLGSGVIFERENDNLTETSRFPLILGTGARFETFDVRLEYSSFRTSDGNQTLSTSREHQSWSVWAAYEFMGEKGWAPYAAAALGVGRSNVESRLTSATEAYSGAWAGNFSAAIGLRSAWTSHFIVRTEFRYESADSFKTKDARMGGVLQIDYLF